MASNKKLGSDLKLVTSNIKSILMVLIVGLLWGLNWTAVKYMMAELPPLSIRAIAFPLAAAVLAIIALLQKQTLVPRRCDLLPLVTTSFFLIFGFNILTSVGQSMTQASNAAIIAYTMPVITAVLSVVYLKERLERRIIVAIALGMTGLAVLASQDFATLLNNPAGPSVMLLAALSWSIGNIAVKASKWSLAPAALAAWLFALAIVPTLPLVWWFEAPSALQWPSTTVVMAMVFHVLGPMVICYQLWTVLLRKLPAAVAAISIMTAPVVAVLSAMLILGDDLSAQKILSLTLIVASIFITLRQSATR